MPQVKTRLDMGVPGGVVDARAKQVLKEAVDAVVNSFAKHTQGYGRGEKSLKIKLNHKISNYTALTMFVFLYS